MRPKNIEMRKGLLLAFILVIFIIDVGGARKTTRRPRRPRLDRPPPLLGGRRGSSNEQCSSDKRGFPARHGLNPIMKNNERTNDDEKQCPTSAPKDGKRICAARPSALLRLNGVVTDVWVSTVPLQRYYIRPAGQVAEARRPSPVQSNVYFAPHHIHRKLLRTSSSSSQPPQDAVFTWVRGQGGAWLPLDQLPQDVREEVEKKLHSDHCSSGEQKHAGQCIKRPTTKNNKGHRCVFRNDNDGQVAHQLTHGYVFPRPNAQKGSPATGEDLLSHYFLRPGGVYNVALSMPASGGSSVAIDVAKAAGDAFFIHSSTKARAKSPYFYGGTGTCPAGKLDWVYGAPESADHAGQPDWSRAGWVPRATLTC